MSIHVPTHPSKQVLIFFNLSQKKWQRTQNANATKTKICDWVNVIMSYISNKCFSTAHYVSNDIGLIGLNERMIVQSALDIQPLLAHKKWFYNWICFVCTFSWKENKYYTISKCLIWGFMCNNKCYPPAIFSCKVPIQLVLYERN